MFRGNKPVNSQSNSNNSNNANNNTLENSQSNANQNNNAQANQVGVLSEGNNTQDNALDIEGVSIADYVNTNKRLLSKILFSTLAIYTFLLSACGFENENIDIVAVACLLMSLSFVYFASHQPAKVNENERITNEINRDFGSVERARLFFAAMEAQIIILRERYPAFLGSFREENNVHRSGQFMSHEMLALGVFRQQQRLQQRVNQELQNLPRFNNN